MPAQSPSVVAFLCAAAAAGAQVVYLPSYPFIGESALDEFGSSVSGAGDVNGDGVDDLIVGAPRDDNNGQDSGSARVLCGATGAILRTFNGDSAGDRFGFSVSGAGDVNDDGFDDLIVGTPSDANNGFNSGSARVLSGATGAVLHAINGHSPVVRFGNAVSGAGDVNGDGFDDVIVGAPGDTTNGESSGSARVFSGATGAILHTFNGDSIGDQFGFSVGRAGDVNDDGVEDVIVGSRSNNARVFSGANGAILHTFNGDSTFDDFGYSVSGAGDVNGDGFTDLIVGAPKDDNNGSDSGSAHVFSGANGAILHTFNGDSASDDFGYSVSGAGDVNADGFADLIVGARWDDNQGSDSGSARVFCGATGTILHTFNGDAAGDQFGFSVSRAGDVNGDGVDELIVGAWRDDNNGSESGSARVFLSYQLPASPKPCPGDVDGDGDSDFADLNQVISNFNTSCAA